MLSATVAPLMQRRWKHPFSLDGRAILMYYYNWIYESRLKVANKSLEVGAESDVVRFDHTIALLTAFPADAFFHLISLFMYMYPLGVFAQRSAICDS